MIPGSQWGLIRAASSSDEIEDPQDERENDQPAYERVDGLVFLPGDLTLDVALG